MVADRKLARPLGKTAKEQRLQLAEFWRSRPSGAAIAADIEAAGDLFESFAPRIENRALAIEHPGAIAHRLPDICGVASLGSGFALSGGRGDLVLADGRRIRHAVAWDNHLTSA